MLVKWKIGDGSMDVCSPPNRRWPNHHHPRDIFAFGKEKRDELLFFFIRIQFDSTDDEDDDRCGVREARVSQKREPNKGNGRTGIGHVLRMDSVTPEADPTLTGAIRVIDRRVTIIKGRWCRCGTVFGGGGAIGRAGKEGRGRRVISRAVAVGFGRVGIGG